MIRVGFIGVPGAGKTTTARALAGSIRQYTNLKTVELVAEYARVYIHKYGIDSIYDQVRILNKQIAEEDRYPDATDIIITDSPIFLGLGYALELREEGNTKHTMVLNDLFKDMNKLNQIPRYDIIFHLPPTNKPMKDGTRAEHHFDDKWRKEADIRLQSVFHIFPPRKLITLEATSTEDRVKDAIRYINEYLGAKSETSPPK
jgi:nicotinamide riboside kinase